jgi:hypothetical protein
VKQFAVRNIDEEDQAGYDMEIPEEISVDPYISEELRQEVTSKGDPVIGTHRSEVCEVCASLDDLRVGDPVALYEKTRKLEEKNEGQRGNVFFFCSELIGSKYKSAKDGHGASCKNEKAEELEKEVEEGPDRACLKLMGERKKREIFAKSYEITCREPLNHVHDERGHEAEDEQGMGQPPVERLSKKFSMENHLRD